MATYEEQFLPNNDDLVLKKLASDLFIYISEDVLELRKINPNIVFLIDWNSIMSLPKNLKWIARGQELGAQENVILYMKFSNRIKYLCRDLPACLCKEPYSKKVFNEFKRMILHIKHNSSSIQANGRNLNEYFVHGTDLHITINANLPLLMIEKHDFCYLDVDDDLKVLKDPLFLYEIDLDRSIFDKELICRIEKIIKLDIGINWRGTRFIHRDHVEEHEECNRKTNMIMLRPDGSMDAAYFPNSIPNNICDEMTEIVELSNIEPKDQKQAIIGGTWNRYGNSIEIVAGISDENNTLLDNLTNCCESFVLDKLWHLNRSMYNKLDTIEEKIKNFKTYAKYPSLALNLLCKENYNGKVKPYRKHIDPNNNGMDVLMFFGKTFEGGNLIVSYHYTNIDFRMFTLPIQSGDLVFLNSRIYHHKVTKVTSGVRCGLVFFAGLDHFSVRKANYKKVKKEEYQKNMDDKLLALPFQQKDKDLRIERTKTGRKEIKQFHKNLQNNLPNKKRKK